MHLFINDVKNLQSTFHNKFDFNRKMIPLTDKQKNLYDKATNCDWCKKNLMMIISVTNVTKN